MLLESALAFMHAGYSVIPASTDGTKAPLGQWKQFMTERADATLIAEWFSTGHPGMGVVCGSISDNLEMLEFEGRAIDEGYFGRWQRAMVDAGLDDLLSQLLNTYIELSPSGGVHFFYRSTDVPKPSIKLASREAFEHELTDQEREQRSRTGRMPPRVLIETRGQGGYVVVAPSHGPVHPTGKPWTVQHGTPATAAVLAADKIDQLHTVCRTLNSYVRITDALPASANTGGATGQPASGELTPGDDFNVRGTWPEILEPHGWRIDHVLGNTTYWTRPGKDTGVSAATGGDSGDYFYGWTTSAELPDLEALSKWRVFAILNYAGDFSRTASELRRRGYGGQRPAGYHGSNDDTADWQLLSVHSGQASGPASGDSASTGTTGLPVDDEWFWSSRFELHHIRTYARARRAAPYAVLGHVLAQVMAAVPPEVKLPPIIGRNGSLNIFVALVAPSEGGKGVAKGTSRDCIRITDPAIELKPGSGEGIAAAFVKPAPKRSANRDDPATALVMDTDGGIQFRSRVLFTASEIGSLAAISKRNGSTLVSELESMFMGEQLGFQNRAIDTRLLVKEHSYRACLTVDVQPDMADVLFDNESSGLLQRFLFVSAIRKGLPKERSQAPEPMAWRIPDQLHPGKMGNAKDIILEVDDAVQAEYIENDYAYAEGLPGAISTHLYFTRLKMAAAFAMLNGRIRVDPSDWELARYLMDRSLALLNALKESRQRKLSTSNKARGELEAERETIKQEALVTAAQARITKRVYAIIGNADADGITHNELKKRIAARDRQDLETAINNLVQSGMINVQQGTNTNDITGLKYSKG
jgi:hypothetical protein